MDGKKDFKEIVEAAGIAQMAPRSAQATIVHLRELDMSVTVPDVLEGVASALAEISEPGGIEVTSVRPASNYTQNATLRLPELYARVLAAKVRIPIGSGSCRVQIRTPDDQCYKCFRPGHVARDCDGPDRERCCYQCGGMGHMARSCKSQAKCLDCNKGGHRTGDRLRCSKLEKPSPSDL